MKYTAWSVLKTMKIVVLLSFFFSISCSQELNGCYVSLSPTNFIGIPGTSFYYLCSTYFGPRASSVKWYLDGKLYNQTNGTVNMASNEAGTYFLEIANASVEFNNTAIMCSLTINDRVCNSAVSILLIQGLPGHVEEIDAKLTLDCIANGSLNINWTESETLDITLNENDVQYHVVVADMFGNTISENVIKNVYVAALPDSNPENASCSSFEIIVTPFNDYAKGNSTTSYITPNEQREVTIMMVSGEYSDKETIKYKLNTFPAICEAYVTLRDIYDDREFTISNNDVMVSSYCYNVSDVVIEINDNVTRHRNYIAIFELPANQVNATVNISTHDIQHSYLDDDNILRIQFLENTTALGAFIILRSEETYSKFLTLNVRDAQYYQLSEDMLGRTIYVYDIDNNGYLSEGIIYPATQPITISGNTSQLENSSRNGRCSLNITNPNNLYVYCHCDVTDALQTIIFQSDDEFGILHSQTGKCLQSFHTTLNTSGLYNIAVFTINKSRGIAEDNLYYTGNITIEEKNQNTTYVVTTSNYISTTDHMVVIIVSSGVFIGVTLVAIGLILISVFLIKMKKTRKSTKITSIFTEENFSKVDEDSVAINYASNVNCNNS